MASEVKLPRLGQGMEAGTIVKWLKSEGDRVEKGEPLYELDTDKVTQEVEAEASGILLRIAVSAGEVPVGQTVAVIGDEGEAIPAAAGMASEEPKDAGAPQSAEKPAEAPRHEAAPSEERDAGVARVKASPLARRIARERGIELAGVRGTGPDGRIVAEDVERAEAQAPAAPAAAPTEAERVPLTSIRKTIARRLTEAWQVPVFQLTISIDMERAQMLVARARERAGENDARVTVTDVLAKICAQALRRHPDVNVQFADDALVRFPNANIGIAVAAQQGLVVPVIRNVESLPLEELARARAGAVERARDNKLRRDDLEGGTFTISNLGMYGVEQFVAVLNPPQAAILAVGATEERAVVRDGAVVARPTLTATLTVDHRAVDGGPAAEFLQTVKAYLEEPGLAL